MKKVTFLQWKSKGLTLRAEPPRIRLWWETLCPLLAIISGHGWKSSPGPQVLHRAILAHKEKHSLLNRWIQYVWKGVTFPSKIIQKGKGYFPRINLLGNVPPPHPRPHIPPGLQVTAGNRTRDLLHRSILALKEKLVNFSPYEATDF